MPTEDQMQRLTGDWIMDTTVAAVISEIGDTADADAMRGQCYNASMMLASALRAVGYEARTSQIWDIPSDDEMAAGHFVVTAETADMRTIAIDLTAAQFGCGGVRVSMDSSAAPSWRDFN